MKKVLAILATTIAFTAMAETAAPVTPAKPVEVTASKPAKTEVKPAKSEKKVEAKAPEAKQSK